ncbi:MAG TPA: TIGR03560 family F420-dependent LLM class oxidoreductase [Chloroflexota bacterium]|jgi:F420-dependent oxidoreductase-like protein
MRFGIVTDQNQSWATIVERWQLFDALGFDSAWDCDHFVQPSRPTGPYFEAWTLLGGLAAVTQRIRVGVLVSSNTFRHPSLLAKQAVTLDHISNGRLDIGLGAGWYAPEHPMFGLELWPPGERVARFEEAVELLHNWLTADTASYSGTYYQMREAPNRPRPVQQPRPPLVLGGHRPRMLGIIARYADTWNSFGTVDEMRERNAQLDEACARVGRDPRSIVRSLYGWAAMMPSDPWESVEAFRDMVGRYAEAGVNEFLIDQPRPEQEAVLERVAAEVLPSLR